MTCKHLVLKIITLTIILALSTTAHAATTLTASNSSVNYTENDNMSIDPGMTVTSDSTLTSARVYIGDGYVSGQDYLRYSTTNGISGSFSSSNGILTLSGSGDAAAYQAAFRNVRYENTNDNPNTANRNITFVLGGDTLYNPDNGHYYESVYVSSSISWTDAKTAAQGRTLSGLQGYLATITSAEENTFVGSKVSADAWIGANDSNSEGDWRWVTGPEGEENGGLGRAFYSGASGGSAVGGEYNNWATGEPNNSGDEDYAHMYGSRDGKEWNDYPNSLSVRYYLVEYGGMSGDPETPPQLTATITVNITSVNDAPTTPGAFTTPTSGQVRQGGSPLTVAWGSSTDVEGDSVKYDLWFFNGSWTQIGNLLTTNSMAFTLPEDNTDSAMFRAYANDTNDNSSAQDVSFKIDSLAPVYTWVQKVVNASTGENVPIIINVTDISINVHNITVDGTEYVMNEDSGNYFWNISVPSSNSATVPSSMTYNCTFIDSLGNANSTGDVLLNVSILPYADFSSNVTRGTSPLVVNFTENSSYSDTYHWDFGDGNTSTGQNPVHTFESGNYTVNLTVSNPNGTSTRLLNIRTAPEPEYTLVPTETERLSVYGEEFNFSIESTLYSSFTWYMNGTLINGSGVTLNSNSNDSSMTSYCLINSSQYINQSDFFMETYNVSVAASNESIGRTDTYSWDWMVTNSSIVNNASDIAFVIEKSPSVNTTGNVSFVQFNTTDNDNTDNNGLAGSIVTVSFNTSANTTGIVMKIEVIDKSTINESETGFSADSIYQYLDISVNNQTLANSLGFNRNIEFRVLNELNGGTLIVNSVSLKHKNSSTWESYAPEILDNDGTYSYYIVYNVSGFSPFAISASYESTASVSSPDDDGMPYYLKKLLLEKREQQITEENEAESEQVNSGSSAHLGENANISTAEQTENITTDIADVEGKSPDDKKSPGITVPVLILIISLTGLFLARQVKR